MPGYQLYLAGFMGLGGQPPGVNFAKILSDRYTVNPLPFEANGKNLSGWGLASW
jgi:hypothetical protein